MRTGIFQGPENDKTYPAKYIVDNLEEAIKLIYKNEGLPEPYF